MKNHRLLSVVYLAADTSVSLNAYAEIYMTPDQALNSLFPATKMKETKYVLSDEEVKKIEASSDQTVRSKTLQVWVSEKKDIFFIDQVLGKHEFITYATAVSNSGKILGIEILEYRETYGKQIKEAQWRKQFVGKDSKSALKVNNDIVNISGATLSSTHVTNGIRRLLKTCDLIKGHI